MQRQSAYEPTGNPDTLEILASEMTDDAQAKIELLTARMLRNAEVHSQRNGRKNFITTRAIARAVVLAMVVKTDEEILR